VLAHEIAHCLFQEGGKPTLRAVSWWVVSTRTEAREADELRAQIPPDDFPLSYLRDFYAALDRRFGEATAEELADREARRPEDILPPDVLDPTAESFLEMLTRVLAEPRLAEECACDAVALNVTAQWARQHRRMSAAQALSAAVVGLHHLRLLRHIEGLASRATRPGCTRRCGLRTSVTRPSSPTISSLSCSTRMPVRRSSRYAPPACTTTSPARPTPGPRCSRYAAWPS
jgi:hypothetical protein